MLCYSNCLSILYQYWCDGNVCDRRTRRGGVLAQHTAAVDQLSLDEAISHFQVKGEKEFIRAIKRVIPVIEATARECLPLLQQLEEKLPGISYIRSTDFEKMDEPSKQLVYQLQAKLDKAVTTLGFLGTLECEHYADGRTKEAITSYIYTPEGTHKSYLAAMGTFNLMKKALVTARSKFFHESWISITKSNLENILNKTFYHENGLREEDPNPMVKDFFSYREHKQD